MKKITYLAAVLLLGGLFSSPATLRAADAAAGDSSNSQMMDKVDAVDREMADLNAAYWAWRVHSFKDVTYEELLVDSKGWIMKKERKKALMDKIRKILDSGKVRELTPAEMEKLDSGTERIRAILNPGGQDTKLINGLSLDYCIDLKARYWARRVQGGEKEILNKMKKWVFPESVKEKLIARTREKLKIKNDRLTKDEEYKSEACTEKMGMD